MLEKLVQLLRDNKRLVLVCGAVLFVVLIVLSVLFGTKSTPKSELVFSETRVSKDNFVHVDGEETYVFNGVGFYKTNQNTKKTSRLALIQNLPNVTDIVWGKNGALVKLEGYSPNLIARYKGTPAKITEIASKEKFLISELNNTAWYIDFNTKQVSFVSLFESEQWKPLVYIESSDYFILSATGLPARQPLLTYSFGKSPELGVIALPKEASFVSNVFECQSDNSLCMNSVGTDGKRSLLVHPNKTALVKIKSGDSFYETTDKNKVLIEVQTQPEEKSSTTRSKNPIAVEHIDEEDPVKSYELYDFSTKTKQKVIIPQEVTVAQPIGYADGVLSLFGDSVEGKKLVYSSKKTSGSLNVKPALTPLDFVPISFVSFSADSFVLKTNNGYVTALKNKVSSALIEQLGGVESNGKLSVCVTASTPSYTEERTLYLSLDDSMLSTLDQTRSCLYEQNSNPFSYSLNIDITSSRIGPVLD